MYSGERCRRKDPRDRSARPHRQRQRHARRPAPLAAPRRPARGARAGLRLSWRVESSSATAQLGFQLRHGDDSGSWIEASPAASEQSIAVEVPGGDLPEGGTRRYAVRVATEHGWSEWSDALVVEAGRDRLDAAVISAAAPTEGPSPYLRLRSRCGRPRAAPACG